MKNKVVFGIIAVVAELIGIKPREAKRRSQALLADLGMGERLVYRVSDLSGGGETAGINRTGIDCKSPDCAG